MAFGARVRMHGWRVYQTSPYFSVEEPQPLNTLTVPEAETFFILDLAGAYLTDNSGNRLTHD